MFGWFGKTPHRSLTITNAARQPRLHLDQRLLMPTLVPLGVSALHARLSMCQGHLRLPGRS